ncbi:cytochrome C oxidase assembly protein [Grimontia sp. AD028]|uniref:Cytochrome c oxidase assembly protein CtaG n=3 Tax=Grimontia TaxID=246861 RepID=R1H066_9GAMM|nr:MULTISPECIES: cytochrome c oxidase assembly protein [Grimontia]EOD81774.1 Cytochrome oxidase biogenesis protein Cox11-CtaG [Grimontia indica]KKD61370.1 cytochrome C oxidase assembly protein [Grimontia sp. AD028]NGN99144.1 cytochrome c oxidase assembly protein [Grimontia sedimenti]USH02559.1 cytochrome c oxidase assembly protein [Grimontia kaedaensis]
MAEQEQQTQKTGRSAAKLAGLAVLMFGFAFALVPLYDVFCDITGINGKTSDVAATESNQVDFSRTVTVEFVAYINPGLGWDFVPEVKKLTVHPGETRTIAYRATNNTLVNSVGQAVPSVTPGLAAQYLNKIECFCFNRQPLEAGKDAELPLVFYVDPELPEDISTLTLAYTLFSAKTEPVTQ